MSLIARFLRFRRELAILWRAFLAPGTPIWLKAMMLLIPAYLLSPIDLIPDVVPILGWIDDAIVIPLLVSWIVSLLQRTAPPESAASRHRSTRDDGPVIDGTARRV